MRTDVALAAVLLAGCSVPAVQFIAADASVEESGLDAGDVDADVGDGGPQSEASPEDGAADAGGDAVTYCYGNPPPHGGKCCPDGGGVCFGSCSVKSCGNCMSAGPCVAPNVCCTTGANGTCQPSCG